MSASWRAALIGGLVAAVLSGTLSFLAAASGHPAEVTDWLPGMVVGAITTVALRNLSGNRPVQIGSATERQAALALSSLPGQATLYVYRRGFVGRALGIDVAVDGRTMAQLKAPRFTCPTLAPGPHRLAAITAQGVAQATPASTELVADPGGILVFRIELAMGARRGTIRLVPVPLNEARAALERMPMVLPDAQEAQAASVVRLAGTLSTG